MNNEIKVYYRLKCSKYKPLLAHHCSSYNTGEKIKEHITFFLPRIYRAMIFWNMKDKNPRHYKWNDLFTHVVSHEYIHKAISDLEGRRTNAQFDNIAGTLGMAKDLGAGL
jgi:hypothetical protein